MVQVPSHGIRHSPLPSPLCQDTGSTLCKLTLACWRLSAAATNVARAEKVAPGSASESTLRSALSSISICSKCDEIHQSMISDSPAAGAGKVHRLPVRRQPLATHGGCCLACRVLQCLEGAGLCRHRPGEAGRNHCQQPRESGGPDDLRDRYDGMARRCGLCVSVPPGCPPRSMCFVADNSA